MNKMEQQAKRRKLEERQAEILGEVDELIASLKEKKQELKDIEGQIFHLECEMPIDE